MCLIDKAKPIVGLFLLWNLSFLLIGCSHQGTEIQYYENGQIKLKAELHNGLRHGQLLDYYEDGSLKASSVWKNGKTEGLVKHFYPNGQLKEETMWVNGRTEGTSKEFFPDGKLKKTAIKEGDSFTGEAFFYYKTGKIKEHRIHDKRGELAYLAGYDEDGFKYVESVIPIFSSEKDTISIGETFKVKIQFGVPVKGDIKLLTGTFDAEDSLIDTSAVIKGNNYIFEYKVKPKNVGTNSLPILVHHKVCEGDTLSAHNVVVKHTFHVKGP